MAAETDRRRAEQTARHEAKRPLKEKAERIRLLSDVQAARPKQMRVRPKVGVAG
jgi:hypothetical protein